jgi:hypothetical protein
MSRGFDGFEIDDSRSWDSPSDRGVDRGPSSSWDSRNARHNIWQEEDRADRLDRETREGSDRERPPLPREERVHAILSQRIRTKYTDRDKEYSLRDSEIHTLGKVGKFRVVGMNDLSEFAYNGDRSRMENDVESLARQGLLTQTTIADPEHNPTPVVTLTKEGHKLLSRGKVVLSSQATYHGLKKPKEAFHDADLYRLYHKVSDEIESRGGNSDYPALFRAADEASLAAYCGHRMRSGQTQLNRFRSLQIYNLRSTTPILIPHIS